MKNIKFKVSELKKGSYYAIRFRNNEIYKARYFGYNGFGFHIFCACVRSYLCRGNSFVKCYEQRVYHLTSKDIHNGDVLPLSAYPDNLYVNRD